MPNAAGLHYLVSGDSYRARAPVLLIHGAGGHHLYWPPQIRRLREHRVFAMDLPGHGRSDGIGRDSIEDYVDDLMAFMAAVGLTSAIWIGHSMGAAIALHAALHQPRRVVGLGLVASGARLRVAPHLLSLTSSSQTFSSALEYIGQRSYSASADARLKELAMQRMGEMRPTVLHGDLLASSAFDESAHLDQVHVPTLILSGTDDRMIPPNASEILHAGISDSTLRIVPNAGHMLMLERPEETADAVAEFVDSIDYIPGSFRT